MTYSIKLGSVYTCKSYELLAISIELDALFPVFRLSILVYCEGLIFVYSSYSDQMPWNILDLCSFIYLMWLSSNYIFTENWRWVRCADCRLLVCGLMPFLWSLCNVCYLSTLCRLFCPRRRTSRGWMSLLEVSRNNCSNARVIIKLWMQVSAH